MASLGHQSLPPTDLGRVDEEMASRGGRPLHAWFGYHSKTIVLTSSRGCGSPMVRVSDHGRYVMSSSPVPLKTRRLGQRCTLNLSRAETSSRWCGVVGRRGDAAQMSSTSLDHGSKLRGPSPKALV
ncbi:uncharacterized protein TNCV_3968731 [Trichonephila clavipes]|nr:uncharacterized protein TNCV_3968731 [Trichonephila clavipes]